MRHEMGVRLVQHRIRDAIMMFVIAGQDSITGYDFTDLYYNFLSAEDRSDFELLESDYNWPERWKKERRAVIMFCSSSEYQLIQYLTFLCGENKAPVHVMDRIMNLVTGVHVE